MDWKLELVAVPVFFADPDGNRWAVQQIVRPG